MRVREGGQECTEVAGVVNYIGVEMASATLALDIALELPKSVSTEMVEAGHAALHRACDPWDYVSDEAIAAVYVAMRKQHAKDKRLKKALETGHR